jgi:hypothetical protein
MRGLFLFFIMLALTGCVSHLSQSQCMTTNWKNEGFKEGVAGNPMRNLSQATEDCMKYGISINNKAYERGWRQGLRSYCAPAFPVGYTDGAAGKLESDIYNRMPVCMQAAIKLNLTAYNRGRQQGLLSFCTYTNGFDYARQGKSLPEVCPLNLSTKFRMGWMAGREQFCSYAKNGFALGKASKPYPEVCDSAVYPAFRSAYDRGFAIVTRMSEVQANITTLNNEIGNKVNQYSLDETGTGYYAPSLHSPQDAADEAATVNALVKDRQRLDAELFNLQVMQ